MSDPDPSVPRFNLHSATFDELPDGLGWMKLLYESPDGARKVGSFKEPGVYHELMPYDEVLYAVAGSTTISVEGGETFQLSAGDVCFLRKGLKVTFENADDFHDVSIFMRHEDTLEEGAAAADTSVPRFNVHTADFDPSPKYNGALKLLFVSSDGSRRAGSFKETGHVDMVMPFDEFILVLAGTTTVTVEGGETFTLQPGDLCYLHQGLSVSFDHSSDFHDVAVLMTHGD